MRCGTPLGNAGDDHARVAVADEDDIVQVFELEHVDDIVDVRVEPHVAGPRRWLRSPNPVRVGVTTSWPAARRCGVTRCQNQRYPRRGRERRYPWRSPHGSWRLPSVRMKDYEGALRQDHQR